MKRLKELRKGAEKPNHTLKRKTATCFPTIIIEQGCPASLIYDLLVQGWFLLGGNHRAGGGRHSLRPGSGRLMGDGYARGFRVIRATEKSGCGPGSWLDSAIRLTE